MSVPQLRVPERALDLADSYRLCRTITRRHGVTYFWGAQLLPPERRRHVHAVYALCRIADDIVDELPSRPVAQRSAELIALEQEFLRGLAGEPVTHSVVAAAVNTAGECGIVPECFARFFAAMRMDLVTTEYQSWEQLCGYMDGSAAVVGEMMLPVLQPSTSAALGPARALGLALQFTNILRDVGEDLDRGRVYLPQRDLERFGVEPTTRIVDDAWRALMAFEISRIHQLYAEADVGIPLLEPAAARCVVTARALYAGILDRIVAADYDVFRQRVRVPTWRKAATALRSAIAARVAR